jgi:hypothetical protein
VGKRAVKNPFFPRYFRPLAHHLSYAMAVGAFPKKGLYLILQRPFGVQNLFCEGLLECKIYFAKGFWSAKFILRRAFGVQNLFCEGQDNVPQNKFCTPSGRKINFALQVGLRRNL